MTAKTSSSAPAVLSRRNIADEQEPLSAIVATPSQEDLGTLRGIFGLTRWNLHAATTRRGALTAAARWDAAAMIVEADLPDGTWREILRDLRPLYHPPRLIVTSRLADDRLWVEVLNLGGYDVLVQPFRASEVIRVVSLAWRNWMQTHKGKVRTAAS